MYTVEFIRGPWAGKTRTHAKDPRVWTCGTDAKAAGMKGYYLTTQVVGRKVKMEWKDISQQAKRKNNVPI